MKQLRRMLSRQYSIAGLATILLVALTGKPGVSFYITFPDQYDSNPYVYYEKPNYTGYTWLEIPRKSQRGGTPELLSLLNDFSISRGGNWQFQSAPNDLQGSFEMKIYNACGPQTDCGEGLVSPPYTGGGGVYFDLHYYPGLGDPIPDPISITRNVQWIQRVTSNHSLIPLPTAHMESLKMSLILTLDNPHLIIIVQVMD